jgi:hypothetical protein
MVSNLPPGPDGTYLQVVGLWHGQSARMPEKYNQAGATGTCPGLIFGPAGNGRKKLLQMAKQLHCENKVIEIEHEITSLSTFINEFMWTKNNNIISIACRMAPSPM